MCIYSASGNVEKIDCHLFVGSLFSPFGEDFGGTRFKDIRHNKTDPKKSIHKPMEIDASNMTPKSSHENVVQFSVQFGRTEVFLVVEKFSGLEAKVGGGAATIQTYPKKFPKNARRTNGQTEHPNNAWRFFAKRATISVSTFHNR